MLTLALVVIGTRYLIHRFFVSETTIKVILKVYRKIGKSCCVKLDLHIFWIKSKMFTFNNLCLYLYLFHPSHLPLVYLNT